MNDLPTVTGLGHEDLFSSHQVTFSKAAPLESRMSLINLTTKKLYPNGGEDVIHQEQQQTCPLKQGHAIWNQPKQGTKGKSLKTTIHLQNQNLFGFFQTISNFPSMLFFFSSTCLSPHQTSKKASIWRNYSWGNSKLGEFHHRYPRHFMVRGMIPEPPHSPYLSQLAFLTKKTWEEKIPSILRGWCF